MSGPPTERTQVRRLPERGVYDRQAIDAILEEALFCHLAYLHDGSPRIIPTIHVRVGDKLYVHGSTASRTLRALRDGIEVCVSVALLDGLVLARSAFNHSMNYRSVIVYGRAREVTDHDESVMAQRALVEHVVPGRAEQIRMPNERELKQTAIFAIPLDEASAKVRTGPPKDEDDDYALPVWAGVVPLAVTAGTPTSDPRLPPGIEAPANVLAYRRPSGST